MKTIVILTIARSGSSLLAGILHRLGVDMGSKDDLSLSKHLNKYGSHENQEFISFSVNLLFDAGILLDFKKRLSDYEDEMKEVSENYREQFQTLINKHSSELWGFKDASMIYYLPYLGDELENPMYIHLIRNYDSTANSLLDMISNKHWKHEYREKIQFFTPWKRFRLYMRIIRLLYITRKIRNQESFIKIVEDAHQKIKQYLEGKKHLTIYLETLIENPDQYIDKIINFLDIKPTKEQVSDAISFVHPELLTK
ncbi:MAG: hypothetical protein EAX90_12080 [Candidatus Heimdallarchaeota archaeon]|nr:hypothetical protein [Candidatus Heimdallarchaeota archaeon]